MAINRSPLTGNPELDSWTNEVTNALSSVGSAGVGIGGTGTGVGQQGPPGSAGPAGMNGANTANLTLYRVRDSRVFPRSDPDAVPGVLDYTYSTATLTGNLNGWSESYPENLDGDLYIFAIQIVIADFEDVEQDIQPSSWSEPRLIQVIGEESLRIEIAASGGNIFKSDMAEMKTLTANVYLGDELQSEQLHAAYGYDWKHDGLTVYIAETTRDIQTNNGEPYVEGDTPPPGSVLARGSGNIINRSITVSEDDINNGATLFLTVDVSGIQ